MITHKECCLANDQMWFVREYCTILIPQTGHLNTSACQVCPLIVDMSSLVHIDIENVNGCFFANVCSLMSHLDIEI